jgi:hypothetical protein
MASSRLNHPTIWFQLTKIWLTNPLTLAIVGVNRHPEKRDE